MSEKRILVTGAAGKVGRAFIDYFLGSPAFDSFVVRALCHNRILASRPRLEIVRGSLEHSEVAIEAMRGVSHVLHLATPKETPASVMDVAVKGIFWLLEACRESPTFRQFILMGGDNSVGHFVYPHPIPVTETQKHTPYPGCYALSKVLDEVILEQYYVQYGLAGCCVRAPWIMEKDDFKQHLSFGEDVFGGPRWRDLVDTAKADEYVRTETVPVMLDPHGEPVMRNFVHVDDLVAAIVNSIDHPKAHQQTFNICMNEPVNYAELAGYLKESRGLPSVGVKTPYYSTWLDNTKAKFLLGWRPQYDLKRMTEAAWNYERGPDDPRIIWYPG